MWQYTDPVLEIVLAVVYTQLGNPTAWEINFYMLL